MNFLKDTFKNLFSFGLHGASQINNAAGTATDEYLIKQYEDELRNYNNRQKLNETEAAIYFIVGAIAVIIISFYLIKFLY
jgi:hypothetical protein